MTIKNLYPKSRPQTIYNVINGRPELPAASTFSRASEATYVDAEGIIQTAPVDEPRFNYDPATGEFLGLLLEGQQEQHVFNNSQASAWNAGALIVQDGNIKGIPAIQGEMEVNATVAPYLFVKNLSTNHIYNLSLVVDLANSSLPDPERLFTVNLIGSTQANWNWRINNGVPYLYAQSSSTEFSQKGASVDELGNSVYRINMLVSATATTTTTYTKAAFSFPVGGQIRCGGCSLVDTSKGSSLILSQNVNGTTTVKEPDAFSLTSSNNFNNGFSLLLDSDTTTDDYFYKIKASGTTIAELSNANGTLDWIINGESAATADPPQYPQVGAIQPGRVRTISSFGAADGTTQLNYLYTEGLSFPTNAIVASGADEVEFGPGQTLKAVYLWNGQLSNTEAVSVIKGEYNIVSNDPIAADTYSFVYNTDPTTTGESSITLPYIVPTVSMRVNWGDGTSQRYEQGVTPSHTYPYPGQYRIQIEADDGFDAVRLGDVQNTITRVDQWAPQHRVGATGDGFTGTDIRNLLNSCDVKYIPDFKYTDLTSVDSAFKKNTILRAQGPNNAALWSWVPNELQEATSLNSMFSSCFYEGGDDWTSSKSQFPQLKTSDKLVDCGATFEDTFLTGFKTESGAITYQPFTDTSKVLYFGYCFYRLKTPTIAVDTQSATTLKSTFYGMDQITGTFPFIQTSNVLNFSGAWSYCSKLTSFPQIDTSSGTSFVSTWYKCESLTSFPPLDFSSATTLHNAWAYCSDLTSFPFIDTSDVLSLRSAWYRNSQLNNIGVVPGATTSFPLLDTSSVTDLSDTWGSCGSLTIFPEIDTSSVTGFYASWFGCSKLTSFPSINTSSGENFKSTWNSCQLLTEFPPLNFSSGTTFEGTWKTCTSLTEFPANMFDSTGTLQNISFKDAWLNCALTAQSIENILVSLDANGQSNIQLGIQDGTNAAKSTWTAAANTAYTNLIGKGWTITFNP